MTPLEVALRYTSRGWSVVPVPHRSKNPGFDGWQNLRLKPDGLDQHFNGQPQNIGVLLGEPSGWLIDVDLDHSRAVELAAEFLPATPLVFGRPGKPRSHWLYAVSAPVLTARYRSKSAGMIVELRSTGTQTIFPPSAHDETGEPIMWENEDEEPALVNPRELTAAVAALADRVRRELGEGHSNGQSRALAVAPAQTTAVGGAGDRMAACLASMRRMKTRDNKDGSSRLFAAACRAVEHNLSDAEGIVAIRQYERERPFPRQWTDDEIAQRLCDAEKHSTRGKALDAAKEGEVGLGQRDPTTGRLVLSPTRTWPTAEAYIKEFHAHPDCPTLYCYAGQLMQWRRSRYSELEDGAVKHRLFAWLHEALRHGRGEEGLVDFNSNPTTVSAALESIRAYSYLATSTASPAWLVDDPSLPPPEEIVPCRSSLLHLPTMERIPATPKFFSVSALDFDHDPDAPEPMAWHRFLHELFDGDLESLELLQEWFGYCLTGDTSQQKMLLIVGPKRSGKGTIARVLRSLVGQVNVCGPTTSSLAGAFGLQPLIGKSLAIVSDARFHGDNIVTVVERLLCISGEDALSVDRKYLGSITMKLPTRFMFMTNEFPRLTDSSGALAGRFVILRLTQSFYGREDLALTQRLLAELPGILNWSIEGWHRLRERGHFVMPRSVAEVVQEIEDLSSPVSAFVREECEVGPGLRVTTEAIYMAWRAWCERSGRLAVGTKHTFGRDLAAAVPGVTRRRGTDDRTFYEGLALRGAE